APLWAEHVGRPEWMIEARQIYGILFELDANELATLWQNEVFDLGPIVMRQVPLSFRGVDSGLEGLVGCSDREGEAGAECVGGAHQVAEIERLRDALGAYGKVPAGFGWPGLA